MPRFFINESPSRQAIITGEDSKHITKSLRMKVGESLVLCNGQGMDYHCTISSMDEHQVVVSVNSSVPTISEPSVSVTLYQGLPKSDKMDSVVQKAVEMGVTRIVPMLTQRCVSRPARRALASEPRRPGRPKDIRARLPRRRLRQGDIASCKPLNGLFSRTKTICFRKHSSLLLRRRRTVFAAMH